MAGSELYAVAHKAMRLVYVAGPFKGPTAWKVEQNIRAAETAALEIWKLGHAALCPHTMSRFYGDDMREIMLQGTMLMMSRCDAVLVVGEHWNSVGTKEETERARNLKIPVFYGMPELASWLLPLSTAK